MIVETADCKSREAISINIVSKPVATAISETRYEVANIEHAYVFAFQN